MIRLLDEKLLAARLDARAEGDAREGIAAKKRDGLRLRVSGQVAIVTISGVIGPAEDCNVHPGELAAMLRRVAGEDFPATVVLELDSPGGYLPGFADVQDAAAYLAQRKTVIAGAHEQASSLAYWIACYAHRIVATASAMVGSIGVMCDVTDTSAQAAMAGVRILPVTDAAGKMVSHPGVPQDESHQAFIRQQLLPLGQRFRAMVAGARRMDEGAIEGLQGASMFGPEAQQNGLVDEVVNWHEWIESLAGGEPAALQLTTKGAGMAAKTTSKGPAAKGAAGKGGSGAGGVMAMSAKELIEKYPDREDEIKGKMAELARTLGEQMEAEGAAGAEGQDPPVDDEAAAAAEGAEDAPPAVPMDEEAAAKAESEAEDAKAEDDTEEAKATAPTGVAAMAGAATIDQLEAFGKGDAFVVAAAKAKLTKPQAAAMAASWAGPATPTTTPAATRPKAGAPVGIAPISASGAAAMAGSGAGFLDHVSAYRQEHRCGEAAAMAACRREHPDAHRAWRAQCKADRDGMAKKLWPGAAARRGV